MTRCADCPYCGKAEGDKCPACGGVNARVWADKKRRARDEAERAEAGSCLPPTVANTPDGGKPGRVGQVGFSGRELHRP